MNIKSLCDSGISEELKQKMLPIVRLAVESGRLTTVDGVALFHAKMGSNQTADAAILIANHLVRGGARYGLESLVPMREWADRYAAHLLDWSDTK